MFKSFIASAAIALTTVVAPVAAEAASLTPGQHKLVNTLDASGVTVEAGECPTDEAYGWFLPSKKFIAICTNVVDSESTAWETLRHEAVHAAQQCMNPNMTSTLTTPAFLQKYGNQSEWEFIKSAYEKHDWLIELEAFTLMKLSNSQVADIVAEACL